MSEEIVVRFLRYYWAALVDFALDIAQLDEREREAVQLCGRRRLTIERAAEEANPPVSVNTMQSRWKNARRRLCRAWNGIEWIRLLADTVED